MKKNQLRLKSPQEARLHNIIDMGLDFSAMIRLFEEGSKSTLRAKILTVLPTVFEAESEKHFKDIHSSFCIWGMNNIKLATRRRKGQIIKKAGPASYGQIAKIFDVVLKVVVYYCHLPNCDKSQQISKWLNAAVDTRLLACLKKRYPEDMPSWPTTIEKVDSSSVYMAIQEVVHRVINEAHNGGITPVQFDDIYWQALNRQGFSPSNC